MYQIAIVDDNESWCFILATNLQQHGYDVSTFIDTDLFLQTAAQFDLALIDFSMPPRRYQIDTDGPDVIRKLKQRLDRPPLTILISSFFTEDILKEIAELGFQADAYLSKSLESSALLQQMEQLLAQKRSLAIEIDPDEVNLDYRSQSVPSLESEASHRHRSSLNLSRSY